MSEPAASAADPAPAGAWAPIELPRDRWLALRDRHAARVDELLAPRERRAARGESHPVWDFLFTYYRLRPAELRRWHPGHGVLLTGPAAADYLGRRGYHAYGAGVTVSGAFLAARADTVARLGRLLAATAARPARHDCFGMHEWAMVYRTDRRRHETVPLRLGAAGTDAVVESMPLRCSHFDAFRFFTDAARPRNVTPLTHAGRTADEQPGCLHANMDLYRACYQLGPLVDSELLWAALILAADARAVDMRAGPYDLSGYGFDPIPVETAAGRAAYASAQQDVARRAAPLRADLIARCELLLARARGL